MGAPVVSDAEVGCARADARDEGFGVGGGGVEEGEEREEGGCEEMHCGKGSALMVGVLEGLEEKR